MEARIISQCHLSMINFFFYYFFLLFADKIIKADFSKDEVLGSETVNSSSDKALLPYPNKHNRCD